MKSNPKQYIYFFIAYLVTFVVIFLIGEGFFRLYFGDKSLKKNKNHIIIDQKYGWKASPNYKYVGNKKDAAGQAYQVSVTTNKDGFRAFGDINTEKKKVFFVGDSYTHALQASDQQTYYNLIAQELPIEVFAYGGSGYGTLQEQMIVDEYVDLIKPDIIVLQLCDNDFINNSFELEKKSAIHNNKRMRPYLNEQGDLFYAVAAKQNVVRKFAKHSYFMYFIISRIDRLKAKYNQENSIEYKIINGQNLALFNQAVQVSDLAIKRITARAGEEVKVLAFHVSTDLDEPFKGQWKKVILSNNIEFIDGVSKAIIEQEEQGVTVRSRDNHHWNHKGHAITAEKIIPALKPFL